MFDSIKKLAIVTDSDIITNVNNVGGDSQNQDLSQVVIGIINVVLGVLATVCVVVIILGGVSYMTSAGDTGKVKKGKDTILYGVIGLVICFLAAIIVNFVISKIINPDGA